MSDRKRIRDRPKVKEIGKVTTEDGAVLDLKCTVARGRVYHMVVTVDGKRAAVPIRMWMDLMEATTDRLGEMYLEMNAGRLFKVPETRERDVMFG